MGYAPNSYGRIYGKKLKLKKKKETKEQVRLGAIEWLLRKIFEKLEAMGINVDSLIVKEEIKEIEKDMEKAEKECDHNWVYLTKCSYNPDGSVEDWIFECTKCGKQRIGKTVEECKHSWVCDVKKCYNPDGSVRDWIFECSKCGKREIKKMEVAIWESEERCKHRWIYNDEDSKFRCMICGKQEVCKHKWELKDTVYNFATSETEWWLECTKCGKAESREVTDELMYKISRICSNHKWVKEYETVNAEGTIVRKTYKCSICGKINIEIKCIHHWIYIADAKKGKNFTLELNSFCAEENGVIYKCRICGKEKIEYKRTEKKATLQDYAIGMKKVVDALPTTEQAAKNFQQALCDHNWIYLGRDDKQGFYECADCGKKLETLFKKECNHNWIMVDETWKDEENLEVLTRTFECTKCPEKQIREHQNFKGCKHNWVLIGSSSSFLEGTVRTTEQIYECSKCGQRRTERY